MITRKINRIFKKNLRHEITFEPGWDRYRIISYWKGKKVGEFVIDGYGIDWE